jgi:hypothetical protein
MKTTLQVTLATRDRLREIGRKDESYDHLVNRLVDVYEQTMEKKTS